MVCRYEKHRNRGPCSSGLALQGDVLQWQENLSSLNYFLCPFKICSCGYRGHVVGYQCHQWLWSVRLEANTSGTVNCIPMKGDSQQSCTLHRLLWVPPYSFLHQQGKQGRCNPKYQKDTAVLNPVTWVPVVYMEPWQQTESNSCPFRLKETFIYDSFIPSVPTLKSKHFLYSLFICLQNIWFLEYIINRAKEETGHI